MIRDKDYSDIIRLPHHVSKVHAKMSISDRAAQFSPFAALTGHDQAIKETARLVEQKLDLDEDQKLDINTKLNYIKENLSLLPEVTILYFQQDLKKAGGSYISVHDRIIKIDEYQHIVVLKSGLKIRFDDIYDITKEGK